ncbi:UDP-N-acetylmuramoyl-L-alanyl-D-glutamate--2,6-diaminopimelate ligase [Paenarthrobacter aurescens]|uniref:UDP-N-acetylmuramyl-tripeptide synthetase n=1 Tax=Paenarthrobacter aurescens TaxID=43663 RepID=A0A4Y3NIB7_PAEAU|nr:UDP-N-acetylmuramoyl-L-alanyl-D-glutamate--2,6-diaminopimelate ligase [Paenarthrobacter aurescens]MDO6143224.1 UDP-N-acetylmuramoyl-L-alanyl-D-glutamate--2,6-diaminopimelate ligase [Paenarthrobacter aurescens]MDO6147070.1 UDP-N-acetylmuramoyl-L-alanyl-D-glutamate--2,6-diaminopimelate ligase [Paenarthrobacter aurescens]MDO6158316.1 UDP-N-acetylmuramoyl-L-alanyl-D-glutamate--2,6-diaminopimelate ligase [Paenarthrobacter aurescens]MDO6162300.1 UDP-N-acetylmuramoyl-L-alanyl-D-glutamate--2,6-diami
MSEHNEAATNATTPGAGQTGFRPASVAAVPLAIIAETLGVAVPDASQDRGVTGISLNSRAVEAGDLYMALPGASRHGADFVPQAIEAGAVAVVTDDAGARQLALAGEQPVPVLIVAEPRTAVGRLAALIYRSQPDDGGFPTMFGVTGTNGKTTTTYFINSLLSALGKKPGLIGTIEILAGGEPIPSLLTTPESTDVHALLALMRERGLDAASMEVSSHAISFHRVDGVMFDVAGFTNLTQDHLDLHGSMEEYFRTKAELFTAGRARNAVVTVDDQWGRKLAAAADIPVTTLSTKPSEQVNADWKVASITARGLGSEFELSHADGRILRVHTGLPGEFNVANAALATIMVLASGVDEATLQAALDAHDPFTVAVPGRMQLVSTEPASVVDFAHNPDALSRALEAVRSPKAGSRVIVVFGATGQRDQGKRPTMGAIAARLADVVIVSDDDPHDEDAAAIRAEVLQGAYAAREAENLSSEIIESYPRDAAIRMAVDIATGDDTILIAGRGHEVWQEVKGVNLALDDRVELRAALTSKGFSVSTDQRIES